MLGTIICIENLTFSFKDHVVLKNLTLHVPEKSIYGFVGPNGAGKTTTIRTLLGLYAVETGKVSFSGKDICSDRIEILSRIGAMVEQPSLYEHLNARDNLEITRTLLRVSKSRIDELLEIVGLTNSSKKKVKAFSLGMKQRLGIAIALLSNPELLILDEPTNGLDPHGIKELRELLAHLNKEFGTTIFLSSHILSEIEKLVTHVGIINKGQMIFEGTLGELYSASSNELIIETDNSDLLSAELSRIGFPNKKKNGLEVTVHLKEKDEIPAIIKSLVNNNCTLFGVKFEQKDLEQIFLDVTKN
jgi:lantibiotic transport system ATP-binding protein